MSELYLEHYGVKGMKWGVRKQRETSGIRKNFDSAKAAYKQANKDYKKSFNKAYRSSTSIKNLTKKGRAQRDANWNDAQAKANALKKANSNYKKAKKARSQAIKKQMRTDTPAAKALLNRSMRKRVATRIVDNNMSLKDAIAKEGIIGRGAYALTGSNQGTSQRAKTAKAKSAYKQAKKDYNKSFNKAYSSSTSIKNLTKAGRAQRDANWNDALSKAETLRKAKTAYKQQKRK